MAGFCISNATGVGQTVSATRKKRTGSGNMLIDSNVKGIINLV